ncbi:MAG: 50S ribosomal protein L25 [Clostridium sp.]|jgi:large subunit ribosomal protein L25
MNTLKAEKRSMDVKAKKLRREGFVTGNVFGKKIEGSIPVKMDRMDVDRLLKTENKGSQILLEIEGQVYDVLIKEIDYNALAKRVDEIDFQALLSNEKVHSVAEIVLAGHEKVISGVLQEQLREVSYRALPSALVDKIKVDVSGLRVGDTIRVKDLEIAKNREIDLLTDLEAVVATVTAVHNVVPETETEEGEEEK